MHTVPSSASYKTLDLYALFSHDTYKQFLCKVLSATIINGFLTHHFLALTLILHATPKMDHTPYMTKLLNTIMQPMIMVTTRLHKVALHMINFFVAIDI